MSTLVSPALGTIVSSYGPRTAPIPGASTFHLGVDIARGPRGIVAPADGVVTVASFTAARGNYVTIDHGGTITRHQHLTSRAVKKGERVTAGQTIGQMGMTGIATGVHLHTEVLIDSKNVDPSAWYKQRGVRLGTEDVGAVAGGTPASTSGGTLQSGSTGARVRSLQSGLRRIFPAYRRGVAVRRGDLIDVDGIFGAQTDAWVREFQRRTGLVVDGIVGPATTARLATYGIAL